MASEVGILAAMVSLAALEKSPFGGPENRFNDNCTFFRCIGMESKLTKVVYCLCSVMTVPNQVWDLN
jgi:hypothetical protein